MLHKKTTGKQVKLEAGEKRGHKFEENREKCVKWFGRKIWKEDTLQLNNLKS